MNVFEKYDKINSKEIIDSIVADLEKIPGAMNPKVRGELYERIQKTKLQIYFQDKYPIEKFPDFPRPLDKIIGGQVSDKDSVKEGKVVVQSQNPVLDIPLPHKTKGSNKYIYGTYMEMAFHNFFQNIQHIYKMVFGKDIMKEAKSQYKINEGKDFDDDFGNEDYVWNPMLEHFEKANPEDLVKVKELIHRHFPVIVPAEEAYKEADCIEIIKRLSQTLRILRNLYSHYYSTPFCGQDKTYRDNEDFVAKLLGVAFIGAKREVKKRFAFDDETMACAEQYIPNRDRNLKDAHGRMMRVKEKENFHYKLTERYHDNKEHLSHFGLVFLTSLFLEKKYSKILADKARCILPQDQSVMTELIAVYRIRLHQEKFYVTKSTDALAFDILTEMRRCPKELFELLRPEEQRKFRVSSSDDDAVLMMRHSDRFAHLVMKYIDDSHLFEDIRFQVSLGKYFYKFYDKRCIDDSSVTRVRALSKNVNGFGRITDMEGYRKELWDTIIREYEDIHSNTSDEKPYVTDHHPRYVINGNRIAMRIFDDEQKLYLPELCDDGATNLVPSCWMSVYELPAMAFLILLRGGAYTEDIIKSTVANYRKLFADVAEGRLLPMADEVTLQEKLTAEYNGVSIPDIPQDMKDYLTGRSIDAKDKFRQSASDLIGVLIEQTEYKLKKFKEQRQKSDGNDNKIGKKGYVKIQPGKLAAFLAKDMMFFQPNDEANRNKLTSLNFRILQSVLALYDGDRDRLERTFASAHIIGKQDDEMCNPIVMKFWDKKTAEIKEFYELYL
ncbi:MAG: type VI-B CRISPR-associated RNA-guided ribonuclease Cas13b, partial [Prevotellaceae bacterium]|nr:type VI-B CRISPR-associated RNA-guided ribonuclease Cas13b [Prevotellaceae bacterium]